MKNITLILLLTIVVLYSCKDEYNICNEPKTVRFIATINQRVGGADVLTTAPNFSLVNLAGNVPIYSNEPNINSFNITFNNLLDSARYVITLANNLPKDTLNVIYTTVGVQATSLDCGPLFNHNIVRLYSTTNTIDSIKIVSPALNSSLNLNAKIYF